MSQKIKTKQQWRKGGTSAEPHSCGVLLLVSTGVFCLQHTGPLASSLQLKSAYGRKLAFDLVNCSHRCLSLSCRVQGKCRSVLASLCLFIFSKSLCTHRDANTQVERAFVSSRITVMCSCRPGLYCLPVPCGDSPFFPFRINQHPGIE